MDFLISSAYAQAAGAAGAPPAQSMMQPLILMVVFVAVFFLFVIRPQMKRAREHRDMVSAIVKGDEVVTSGGILGRIEEVGESFLGIEIADKVVVRVQKNAVAAVLPKGTLKSA